MDTEQIAEQVLQAVESLLEKRLRPVLADIAAVRLEIAGAGYLKAADLIGLARSDVIAPRLDELVERVKTIASEVAARPTLDVIRAEQAVAAGKAAADIAAGIRVPQDGKSITVDDVRPLLEQMVAAIPRPKDGMHGRDGVDGKDGRDGKDGVDGKDGAPGKDGNNGRDGIDGKDAQPAREGRDGADGKDGAPGRDGKDAEVDYKLIGENVDALVEMAVREKVAALPVAKDGAPGRDGVDGKDGIDGRDGKDGAPGEPGAAGKDADLATLREIVSISVKAAIADIPTPNGGAPGKDADPVDMQAVARMIEADVRRAVDALPRPKDGADGMSIDDMDLELKDDGRTLVFRFAAGERAKEYALVVPWQIYREVWKAGAYSQGDTVTYGGSQWTARRDTRQTPGTGDDWVLSVKRGRDGKDAPSE